MILFDLFLMVGSTCVLGAFWFLGGLDLDVCRSVLVGRLCIRVANIIDFYRLVYSLPPLSFKEITSR